MNEALAALLVCPITRAALRWDPDNARLISDQAGLAYPIRGGTAVLLAEEAVPLGSEGRETGGEHG